MISVFLIAFDFPVKQILSSEKEALSSFSKVNCNGLEEALKRRNLCDSITSSAVFSELYSSSVPSHHLAGMSGKVADCQLKEQ